MLSQNVLLAGATGMLGARIASHLLDADASVKLLLRPGTLADDDKRASIEAFTDRGAELVEGDVADPASLVRATRDVDVVVSALQGGREVIVDGQMALARAAAENGARRILPSDFALDLFKSPPGLHAPFDLRREADEAITQTGLQQVNVLMGAFADFMTMNGAVVTFDDEAGIASFWGTGAERFEATSVEDTARFAARAALDPDIGPGKFAVAGEHLSFEEIVSVTERRTGQRYERRSRGTTEDLHAWIADQRTAGNEMAATMATYQLLMLTGETALEDLQNDRYPDLQPRTLAQLAEGVAA